MTKHPARATFFSSYQRHEVLEQPAGSSSVPRTVDAILASLDPPEFYQRENSTVNMYVRLYHKLIRTHTVPFKERFVLLQESNCSSCRFECKNLVEEAQVLSPKIS